MAKIKEYGKMKHYNPVMLSAHIEVDITEKVDGGGARFWYDANKGEVMVGIRTSIEGEKDCPMHLLSRLKEFLNIEENRELIKKYYVSKIFFFELMNKEGKGANVRYDRPAPYNCVLFDIWDRNTEMWSCYDVMQEFADAVGLDCVKRHYSGIINSKLLREILTKASAYGKEQEGIVIKSDMFVEDGKKPYRHCFKMYNPNITPIERKQKKGKFDAIVNKHLGNRYIKDHVYKFIHHGRLYGDAKNDLPLLNRELNKDIKEEILQEADKDLLEYARKLFFRAASEKMNKVYYKLLTDGDIKK